MPTWIAHFASGNSLFTGVFLVALALSARMRGRCTCFARLTFVLGWFAIALSATPVSLWTYALWFGLSVLAGINPPARLHEHSGWERLSGMVRLSWFVMTLLVCGLESQTIMDSSGWVGPHSDIYVIGDSLSAGINDGTVPWPENLRRRGYSVVNLARPGATVRSARQQTALIPTTAAEPLIIVEIGGNDLLSGRSGEEFAEDLRDLLAGLNHVQGTIALMELPLPPGANRYGEAQRRACDSRQIHLISKRILIAALIGQERTLDGLHLSTDGHRQLADWFAKRLPPP